MNLRLTDKETGFTLMELMIVVALIGLIAAGFLTNWQRQIERGHDAQRKRDLANLQRALEEYANDNGCFPDKSTMDIIACGDPVFDAYGLKDFPCDPNHSHYAYEPADLSNTCAGYRIYANLANDQDPDIARVGCDALTCVIGTVTYNFGVSAGVPVAK